MKKLEKKLNKKYGRKIKKFKNETKKNNVWFISDTHFYHHNIIRYCNRPFKNVEEMNQTMIQNWNNIINKEDKVFHLGDFSFGDFDEIKGIACRLNGNKYLIKGNHDRHSTQFYLDCGFKGVYDYPILYNEFYILSHWPIYLMPNVPYVNLHGHIHNNQEISCISEGKNLYYNLSVEVNDYKPINFEKIKKYYE